MTDETVNIENPWIIVHELPNKKMQTLLAGPEGAGYEQFALAVADIIGHVAQHFDVDDADVLRWIKRELDDPTTKLEGGRIQ